VSSNRLARETSPYLLQHADNPVDWYPWGEEAHSRALAEDLPILLSIGYSSCHWCHVMERESFEDAEVAARMNRAFVCVKVDREERPDVDQIYMKAVQAMTGSGGWPLTVFLTPERVPYYGGTYFPPVARHGMPSFSQLLEAAARAYRDRPDDVRAAGGQLLDALRSASQVGSDAGPVDPESIAGTVRSLKKRYDPVHGGFGSAPKFPQPSTLELLLRHHARTGDAEALQMAIRTLRGMAAGGIRDHLAGGFHRYSVDAGWLVPHFEKMLYDNALLARAYTDGFRLTGDEELQEVAAETLDYLLTDMRDPEGGFYAARDADSEGEEGRFYLWTAAEVETVAGPEDAEPFMGRYGVTPGGNFEGRNILHLPLGPAAAAGDGAAGSTADAVARARARLLEARADRVAPFRDEKVLVSWNAMTLRALAEAGATFGRWAYVDAAVAAADFLWSHRRPDGRIPHSLKDGRSGVDGFLDDHAALGNALLSLHAATLDPKWLTAARELCELILAHFWSEADGVFYDAAEDAEALIVRPRETMDSATPSGTSLACELLVRAAHVFDDDRYRERADAAFATEAEALRRFGPAFGRLLSALDRAGSTPVEVAIIGDPSTEETRALIRAAHGRWLSNLTIVGAPPGESVKGVPLLDGRTGVAGRATAYVCRNYACDLPVTTAEEVARRLAEAGAA
jgi:uncharacterized protein